MTARGAVAGMRTPTRLVDVAREAGVHVSTVSRVLNDRDEAAVRPETRERILATAHRLRYRPNALARGLKTATTTTFGLLVPSLRNPVYASIVRGAVTEAWRLGYVVLVAEDDGTVTEQAWERLVEEGRIDGILVASVAPGRPVLQLARGQPRPLRVREPPPARQRAERLHARGGCRPHRRLAPARSRAHAPRPHRRAARARHGAAPRRGVQRGRGRRRPRAADGRGGGVRRGVRLRGHGTPAWSWTPRRPVSSSRTSTRRSGRSAAPGAGGSACPTTCRS